MAVSPTALNGIQNNPVLRSSEVPEVTSEVKNKIVNLKNNYKYFSNNTNNDETYYISKRNKLLGYLNGILGKNYSFGTNGLTIESIFNENCLPNSDNICNAGKKAYAYYLKEVLQKLNLLNEHILKGQAALKALDTCTNAAQIKNYETILEIQDGLVKKYLDDFNKYTVVQTLTTERKVVRIPIGGTEEKTVSSDLSVEINYATKGKIWNEAGQEIGDFSTVLDSLSSLDELRNLKTAKQTGFQTIITTLINKHTEKITDLNDPFGFNVVDKQIIIPEEQEEKEESTTPIALFDELTLLEKLKYVHVYYNSTERGTDKYPYEFYHYPNDLKSGIPCMSRDELLKYVPDTNTSETTKDPEGNDDELEALGIIPSDANKPKTDLVEPGAIELFYVGYLKDSQGAINALAAFMEIKSVSLLAQIEQQSYRIKALKTYLKMLEFALQELNSCYEGNTISTKAYLAIKYAAANQTRTLVNINGDDYIVLQEDGGQHENHNISKNNAYIYVKATEEGIREFLGLQWDAVEMVFHQNNNKAFRDLTWPEVRNADANNTKFGSGAIFYNDLRDYGYNYLHKEASISGYWVIEDDGKTYRFSTNGGIMDDYVSSDRLTYIYPNKINPETHKMVINEPKAGSTYYNYIYYYKKEILQATSLTSSTGNILFAKFNDNTEAIKHLPKELETVKVSMSNILDDNFGAVGINWRNKNNNYKEQWRKFVDMWQNVNQTAIENIGSQIESVNKTIKSLRSKIDTFDSSASRFRDKFYSTTMTVLNKLS